jgi:hypothetical protein
VFPLAIGGCLSIDRVCELCNSALGSRVDAALSDNFIVRTRRAELRLAGNSGVPPAMHEIFLGAHELDTDPGQRIKVTFNEKTGQLDLRHLPRVSDSVMPDGSTALRITVDDRDFGEIPKIIQKVRQRHGLPPLSKEHLAEEVEKATASVVKNPSFRVERSYSSDYLRHAMIKIAYELAFRG